MSDYVLTSCWKCREQWSIRRELIDLAKKSGTPLYCPFGHAGYWKLGKTDTELLEEKLDEERRRRQSAEQRVAMHAEFQHRAERSASAYKGIATKLKRRAQAGVCPCCKRTVKQLAAHMASKHPEFSANPDGDLPKDVAPILSVVEGGKA